MSIRAQPATAATGTPRRRRRSGERAQSMVEFALILPIFLLVIMATVDFGWALRSYIVVTNAAREGARLGVIGETEANIEARVADSSAGLLSADDIEVTGERGAPGTTVTVRVDYDYTYISPLGGLLSLVSGGTIPNPLPLSTTTRMRLE